MSIPMTIAVIAVSSLVLVFGSVLGGCALPTPVTPLSRPPLALGPGVGGAIKPGAPGGTMATNVFVVPLTEARTHTQPLGNVAIPSGATAMITLGVTLGCVAAGTGCVNAIWPAVGAVAGWKPRTIPQKI